MTSNSHRITGWTIKPTNPTENDGSSLLWEVELVRDASLEDDRDTLEPILKHPSAEETDDYMEYKRIRKEMLHKVREEIRTGIPATVPQTPPPLATPEKASVTIQSPHMSPKTETSFFVVGDYCLLREPVLPGSPESPPLTRTPFFQPPSSPRVQTGPVFRPDRTTSTQPRSLTVPQNLRKSLSTINAETKGKKTNTLKKTGQKPMPPENDGDMTTKEPSARSTSTKDNKNSFAKSFTRIFSDGARDSDTPESPFGSVFPLDHEPSSYPFDAADDDDDDATLVPLPPPIPSFPQLNASEDSSDANPAYRQVHWGKQPDSSTARKEKHRNASAAGGNGGDEPLPKSRDHRRRDRAVYEAFDREECPEPRLLLAALNEVWDDCEQPEYPDMVLEEPTAYESNSGYSGGFGEMSRSEDYLRRIPPGGIDVGRFIAQQAAVVASGGGSSSSSSGDAGRRPLSPMRRSWHGGDEGSGEHAGRAHGIGRVLREMSESSAASLSSAAAAVAAPESIIARRQRLSTGSSDSSVSERGGGGSGIVGARRSSLSAFDTRMPSWGLEDGARGAGRSLRRPTIVRFSGMFNRQSLQETVDEAVDEGKEVEEDREDKRKEKEREKKDKSPGKTEELGFLF